MVKRRSPWEGKAMRFQVFKDGKVFGDFALHGAYVFGTDGMAVRRATIESKGGLIKFGKPNLETAGLALLWPVDGFGKVLLPTTCLPERTQPYNLNLEIARAKLMQIVQKREDWSFFDGVDELRPLSDDAQKLFIKAVQNISDAARASRLADESLKKAMIFSERIAAHSAASGFGARGRNHGFGRICLGCRVNPEQITNAKYVEHFLKLFSFAMIPMEWGRIEPEKGIYDFSSVDACVNVLGKRKVALGAGPLLRFSEDFLPKWLLESGGSFEKIRESAYTFVATAAARYAPIIRTWCVISGLNAFNRFGFGFEQILEITRAATMGVKAATERAVKIIEVTNPWGEYYATTADTIPPLVYMDMVVQSGINFDAFGLQMRFGADRAGMHVRDMMQISAILDYLAPIAKSLYVTEVEVPSRNGSGPNSPQLAGIWHKNWDELRQGQWLEQFYRIALSKPFVDSVVYSNLSDTGASVIANSGLLTAKFEPKKSYDMLRKLRHTIYSR